MSKTPAQTDERRCELCEFWLACSLETGPKREGECRRYPRAIYWTRCDYWCGEFRPKATSQAGPAGEQPSAVADPIVIEGREDPAPRGKDA